MFWMQLTVKMEDPGEMGSLLLLIFIITLFFLSKYML